MSYKPRVLAVLFLTAAVAPLELDDLAPLYYKIDVDAVNGINFDGSYVSCLSSLESSVLVLLSISCREAETPIS